MIAYFIRCSGDVGRVPLLLNQIFHPENTYIISVDPGFDRLTPVSALPENCHLVRAGPVTWGGESMLNVYLSGMRDALELNRKWQYFINLSESCIALRTQEEIFDVLAQQRRVGIKDFIPHSGIFQPEFFPDLVYSGKFESRMGLRPGIMLLNDVVLGDFFAGRDVSMVMRPALRASFHYAEARWSVVQARPLDFMERRVREKFFTKNPMRTCNVWAIFSRESIFWLLNSDIALNAFSVCRSIWSPEECFFITALAGDGSGTEPESIKNWSPHWRRGIYGSLSEADLQQALSSDAFFMRKYTPGFAEAVDEYVSQISPAATLFSDKFESVG